MIRNQRKKARYQGFWIPYFIVLATLLLTTVSTYYLSQIIRENDRLRFQNQAEQTKDTLQADLATYTAMLRGVGSLFAATSTSVSRANFRAYVDGLDVATNYPGSLSVGFIQRVPAEQRSQFTSQLRRSGMTDFSIQSAETPTDFYPIVFLEPQTSSNLDLIGFDMASEHIRNEAMLRATDTGQPVATHLVELLSGSEEEPRLGFLIFSPIYRDGTIPTTTTERRQKITGFAFSPLLVDRLFSAMFSNKKSDLGFDIYEGLSIDTSQLLYASDPATSAEPHMFTTTNRIIVANQTWTLRIYTNPGFDTIVPNLLIPFVLLAGAATSFVLYILSRSQVQARAQAEEAVRARDLFLSVASHELRTPLTTLLGNAQLLQRRALRSGSLPERDLRTVGMISEQSKRLSRLINALLDHSRIEAGRFTIECRTLDLLPLAQRVTNDLRFTAMNHELRLCLPEQPLHVSGDEMRLEQMMQNLIGNAIKYSPRGGPVDISLRQDAGNAVFQVTDYGIGIPKAAQSRLFNQFYRAPNSEAQHISGLGIGLYLIKEIIALHKGTIAVQSTEGEGSTFTVTIPLATPAEPATTEPAA